MTNPWVPTSSENCALLPGPFYHGTRAALPIGAEIAIGHLSHYENRVLKHVYFSSKLEPAIWGAELAVALTGHDGRGHIYVVVPTGPFEDDPNLTNKRFPGNPTQSYRSHHPLRIVDVVADWQGHPPEIVQHMLKSLAELRARGIQQILD